MDKLFKKYLLTALISFVILLGTLYVPVIVDNQLQMNDVWLGYPIPFIKQNLTYNPPTFPKNYKISSVWENPTKIV